MAEEVPPPPSFRLMNFVSEEQLDEAKKNRGERVEDGTAQRDRPLFEILKDNKDKKDLEFNERFKHRPPKALDEDESEFLDSMEMSRKEYEQQLADEEANQLRSFQVAVAVHSTSLQELKETPVVPKVEELKPLRRKNPPANPLGGLIIKVRPQAKKAKTDESSSGNTSDTVKTTSNDDTNKSDRGAQSQSSSGKPLDTVKTTSNGDTDKSGRGALGSLVSYSDESEEDGYCQTSDIDENKSELSVCHSLKYLTKTYLGLFGCGITGCLLWSYAAIPFNNRIRRTLSTLGNLLLPIEEVVKRNKCFCLLGRTGQP